MIVCAPAITAVIVALAIAAPEQAGARYPVPLRVIPLALEGSPSKVSLSARPLPGRALQEDHRPRNQVASLER